MESATVLGFLDLPAEVRIQVYQHLFSSSQLSIEPSYRLTQHCCKSICSCAFPWHIVNTCQRLRVEALPYLLAGTSLQVVGTTGNASLLPSLYLASVPRVVILNVELYSQRPLQLESLSGLRTLEVRNIVVWCRYHDEQDLLGEGGDEVMINSALFNLKRSSAQLHSLCNVRGRGFKILLSCRYVISSVKQETLDAMIDVDNQAVLYKQKGPVFRNRNPNAGFY